MSGVNTRRVDFLVMTNMGLLAGLAGLVTTARLTAANPKTGVNFELDAIAAAFIGGAAVTGGVGTVIGAIIGGLVMGVLNNGMSLMGVSIDWQQSIKGLVLLAAVAFDVWNKKRTAGGGGAGAEAEASTAPPPDELSDEMATADAGPPGDHPPRLRPRSPGPARRQPPNRRIIDPWVTPSSTSNAGRDARARDARLRTYGPYGPATPVMKRLSLRERTAVLDALEASFT